MDIRRYMPGFGRVGAIPVADSADGAKVLLDGDGIAVDNSIDSVASSAAVPENAIVSDVAATNAASTGSNSLVCDNCKQREIDDAPKKCSHVKWCSYCDEALWQTNATAADAAATNAVSSDSETLICVNCKQRAIGNAAKKCGFLDWCSFCDESLWQTNPEVIRATSVDATDTYGFKALGSGWASNNSSFTRINEQTGFQTTTSLSEYNSCAASIWDNDTNVTLGPLGYKSTGLSIRLVKDNSTYEGDIIIDGDTYNTVTIGTQIWTQQNLAVTHYQNGDPILSDFSGTVGAVTTYNNDENNVYY